MSAPGRPSRPWSEDASWRLLRWLGCLLLILVGGPLYVLGNSGPPADNLFLMILYWLLILTAVILIFIRQRRDRRRNLIARHICTTCGYDLRATPTRCPECGACPPTQ